MRPGLRRAMLTVLVPRRLALLAELKLATLKRSIFQ